MLGQISVILDLLCWVVSYWFVDKVVYDLLNISACSRLFAQKDTVVPMRAAESYRFQQLHNATSFQRLKTIESYVSIRLNKCYRTEWILQSLWRLRMISHTWKKKKCHVWLKFLAKEHVCQTEHFQNKITECFLYLQHW